MMDPKSILRAITLELRHELEGKYDLQGDWQPGDLERRLAAIGVRRDRSPVPVDELSHLSADDREARRIVDAFIQSRAEGGRSREAAIADFVREAAYSWANRLLALRCMEARGLIDEVILQKVVYGDRSLQHQRFARKEPERCVGEDEGLFAVLFDEFTRCAKDLPLLFDPKASEVALRPSVAALKRCVGFLSGTLASKGQEVAMDEVFTAPDALGWTYQYWNTDEKDRVFEKIRTNKGTKIEGGEIIPATCIYTEPYMVKFLVQNSLGAMWMRMNPSSPLCRSWEYYVQDADRGTQTNKAVSEISFLDPACGSGHFLLEAFDLFYAMYLEEGAITNPAKICSAILEGNLYGIDIDERAIQIAAIALLMKAKEKAPDFVPRQVNLVATNIRLPADKEHLDAFLRKHPEDAPLKPALFAIFEGLAHADELGSLLQIEEPVEKELHALKARFEAVDPSVAQQELWAEFRKPVQGMLPIGVKSYEAWKQDVMARLRQHFGAEAEAQDLATAFFGEAASKGLSLLDLLARRYDVVTANPPYMGSRNMGAVVKGYVERHFAAGKRDLYAAFILRCTEMLEPSGIAALVTMNKWLHARAYASIRCGRTLSAAGVEQGERSRQNLLWNRSVSILADLGSRAFDPDNHFHSGVQVALFVVTNVEPTESTNIAIIDCVEPDTPEGKDYLIRRAARGIGVRRASQLGFASLPGAPLCYRLPIPLLAVLQTSEPLGRIARVRQGICTTSDPRFVRMHWEVPSSKRWCVFAKGGGHRRWDGLRYFAVDWDYGGTRIKQFITDTPHAIHWSGRMPESDYYFKEGWCYSRIAFGNLGIRHFRSTDLFGHTNPIILFNEEVEAGARWAHAGLLNSPLVSYVLRSITQSNDFHEGYLRRLPYPRPSAEIIQAARIASETALAHARAIVADDLMEPTFQINSEAIDDDSPSSITDLLTRKLKRRLANELVVSVCERTLQLLSYRQWLLNAADASALDGSIGGTRLPAVWSGLPIEAADLSRLTHETELLSISDNHVDDQIARAAKAYLAGESSEHADFDEERASTEEDDDEPGEVSHWPSFGTVDAFAKSERVDLGRAYRALMASIDRDGPGKELVAIGAQVMVVVIALRLLGHKRPAGAKICRTPLIKGDGIVVIHGSIAEPPLLARVQAQITADFGVQRSLAIEREFEEVVGQSLSAWLATNFFRRHISQFKRRPIAWQLQSRPTVASGKRGGGRSGAMRGPGFACLVHYRQLDADLLPKICSHYLGGLRTASETELRTLERLAKPTADQATHKVVLESLLDELHHFDSRLHATVETGFGPESLRPRLRQLGVNDAILAMKARWLGRLRDTIEAGPLAEWQEAAATLGHHEEFPRWIGEAIRHLPRHCTKTGVEAPNADAMPEDPTPALFATMICAEAASMTRGALTFACADWRQMFDAHVIEPLRYRIAAANVSLESLDSEFDALEDTLMVRGRAITQEKARLRTELKELKREIKTKIEHAEALSASIRRWISPVLETWEPWLAAHSLFDVVSSADGRRAPPVTIQDFIRQESIYAPDLNDGVRVNIAPLQRAGLLAADVLDPKDVEKAIADRAEWRADERRWCREGRLPCPGWWPEDVAEVTTRVASSELAMAESRP